MDEQQLHSLLVQMGLSGIIRRNNNLMACCPFHSERNPSWGISLTAPHPHGCFSCGAKGVLADLLERSGKFSRKQIKLLVGQVELTTMRLPDFKRCRKELTVLDYRLLFPFRLSDIAYRYMRSRGVPDWVTRKVKCLYDHFNCRVLFPWYLDGLFVGLTGRAVDKNKVRVLPYFSTQKGQCLYLPAGRINVGTFIMVEGEVDALKVYAAGFANVGALGFGQFADGQKDLVLNSPAHSVTCFFDDDETGERLKAKVVDKIQGIRRVNSVNYKSFRKRYDCKLDPGALTLRDIRWALRKCVDYDCNWPTF